MSISTVLEVGGAKGFRYFALPVLATPLHRIWGVGELHSCWNGSGCVCGSAEKYKLEQLLASEVAEALVDY